MSTIVFLPLLAGLIAFGCCLIVLRRAHKWKLIDKPNDRSSHRLPTASGGGIGLVVAGSTSGLYLLWISPVSFHGQTVLLISCVLAMVGLFDDRKPLPAIWRLGAHVAMGGALLFVLGGLPEMQRFVDEWLNRTLIYAGLLLILVWWINLFNFMDGIDGLAAMQTIFMLAAGAALLIWPRQEPGFDPVVVWMLCVASATAGFLFLNWAPAKIFMGDVGSIYLAFMLLAFGLLSIRNELIPVVTGLAMWAILGAGFATDATITLMTRMLTSRRWHEAHRNHLYQRLARRFKSHRWVTLIYLSVNIFWLLPIASACLMYPEWAVAWMVLAYVPLIVLAVCLGAGRSDL